MTAQPNNMADTKSYAAPAAEDIVFLSTEEVAQSLGVSRWTIRRFLLESNFPKPVKVGGRPKFLRGEIDAYKRGLVDARYERFAQ